MAGFLFGLHGVGRKEGQQKSIGAFQAFGNSDKIDPPSRHSAQSVFTIRIMEPTCTCRNRCQNGKLFSVYPLNTSWHCLAQKHVGVYDVQRLENFVGHVHSALCQCCCCFICAASRQSFWLRTSPLRRTKDWHIGTISLGLRLIGSVSSLLAKNWADVRP
ncbi:hypothetical protein VTI28DRAFT_4244 [Corynascus sepedonium]